MTPALIAALEAYWTAYQGRGDVALRLAELLAVEKAGQDPMATLRRLAGLEADLRASAGRHGEAQGAAARRARLALAMGQTEAAAAWERRRIAAANCKGLAEGEADRIARAADSIARRVAYADSVLAALKG